MLYVSFRIYYLYVYTTVFSSASNGNIAVDFKLFSAPSLKSKLLLALGGLWRIQTSSFDVCHC